MLTYITLVLPHHNIMSYYILPRVNSQFNINVTIHDSMDTPSPCVSSSLLNYTTESKQILEHQLSLNINNTITMNMLKQVIHSYDFLFSNILGTEVPVSKLVDIEHPIFYDIAEIYQTLRLNDMHNSFSSGSPYNTLFCGKNASSVMQAYNMLCGEDSHTPNIVSGHPSNVNLSNVTNYSAFDGFDTFPRSVMCKNNTRFIYTEAPSKCYENINEYVLFVLKSILSVMKLQSVGGCFIMKIDCVFYKPIIDLIYIISNMYAKTYLMKPNTSNIITDERYVVCKSFIRCEKSYYNKITRIYNQLKNSMNDITIGSLLDNNLYYYFLNKIEESNVIIGQQKLDAYGHLITLLKSKNKLDKIEILKKHNIQKCIFWCEKHNIPCNKLIDKNTSILTFVENNTHYEMGDGNIDDVFYSYIEKNYGYTDVIPTDELEYSDIIDGDKLASHRNALAA